MQSPINLLPEEIRARGEAGMRTGRYVAAVVLAAVVLVVVTTYTKLAESSAKVRLEAVQQQADLVFENERRSAEFEQLLEADSRFIETYRKIALPLPVSGVVATLIAKLPESVALDRFDLRMTTPRAARSPRSQGQTAPVTASRYLNGELSGFAASDQDVTQLVSRLQELGFLNHVNLDFTRSREVREQTAREFRLSFRIDLNAVYEIDMIDGRAVAGVQESVHVD